MTKEEAIETVAQIIEPKPLAAALQDACGIVDDHYVILVEGLRKIADDLRDRANFVDSLAEQIKARNSHIQSEITAAGDFEELVRGHAIKMREIVQKVSIPVTNGGRLNGGGDKTP